MHNIWIIECVQSMFVERQYGLHKWMNPCLLTVKKNKFSYLDNLYNTSATYPFLSLLIGQYLLTAHVNLWAGLMVWSFYLIVIEIFSIYRLPRLSRVG